VAVSNNKKMIGMIACVLGGMSYQVQAADDNNIFTLGEIQVTAPKDQEKTVIGDTLDITEIRKFNRETVGSALNLLPGITLTNGGARNEQMITVRGYDVRQVPLFIDGIPVYIPYDGYVDLGRFTTGDLAAIQVSKGYSSVSFGPNTLGGAINLISRKPTKALEGDARIGYGQENTHEANVNVGTNQGNWYAQAGVSFRNSDGFRMSDDFKPSANENGGQRNNAQYKDSKVSLKLGITPNETDEYALSFYKQNGEKGNPPTTDTRFGGLRFWQWPQWDKESLYFISKTALSNHEALKLRLFVDKFDNTLNIFTNASYSVLSGGLTSGVSIYHDKTHGGMVELESTRIQNNTLRLFTEYKVDKHEAIDGLGVVGEKFEDTLRSIAIEDAVRIGDKTIATFGFAHHEIEPDLIFKTGFNFTKKELKANDPQVAISYQWNDDIAFYASAAQKTRLPTLKDRYSLRFGTFIESPDLEKEKAHNYEIGYKGSPWTGATAQVALFQNDIDDKIQSVVLNGAATCTTINKCQNQNVGEVRIKGIELSLNTPLGEQWIFGGNITKMDVKNLSDSTRITNVPDTKIITNLTWLPATTVRIIGFAEYNSSRWVSNTAKVDGFTTMNLKAGWQPVKNLTAEVGVNNIADKNYYLDFGYPNPGRMWFTNLSYLF
jgi:iron complex outermembrane recepter protein